MIRIHHEGFRILLQTLIILGLINFLVIWLSDMEWLENSVLFLSLVVYILVLQFFRNPKRFPPQGDDIVIAPADGKIVAIEEIEHEHLVRNGNDLLYQLGISFSEATTATSSSAVSAISPMASPCSNKRSINFAF